jgi:hypothetical protein
VACVTFSPDGRRVATTSYDRTGVIRDVETAKQLVTLKGHGDWVQSVAFNDDGTRVVTASLDNTVAIWDSASGKRLRQPGRLDLDMYAARFVQNERRVVTVSRNDTAIAWDIESGQRQHVFAGHTHEVVAEAISPDGRLLLTGSLDGTARLWDLFTGVELASLVSGDSGRNWVVASPVGLFDGTENSRNLLSYRFGERLPGAVVDQFFPECYYPGLLAALFAGERPLPKEKLGRSLPPHVKIVSPKPGPAASPEVTLEVEIVDQGGGISNLAVFHNGARLAGEGQTRKEGTTVRASFKLALIQGGNQVRVAAASGDGSWEAKPAQINLDYLRPLETRNHLHVLAIGVGRHADPSLNLKYPARDAEAMAELFRRSVGPLVEQVHITTLLDEQATRQGIRDALQRIAAQTRPQDSLVVFLAGHGAADRQYYFVPHDLRRQKERFEDDLRTQGLSGDEITAGLGGAKALKRVLILDTCTSGGLAGAVSGRSNFALRGMVERSARLQGIYTIATVGVTEKARESEELGHGLLTYALLAGLKGVDNGPLEGLSLRANAPNRPVDLREWFTFATSQLPMVAEQLWGAAQDVEASSQANSFPLLRPAN